MSGPKTESGPDEWMAGAGHSRHKPFGDGGHPTTFLATQLLTVALCRRRRGARVLDAGCGSGRLSEIATALGAVVTAVDRDPRATVRTRSRAPSARTIHGELSMVLGELGRFAVVVANLPEPDLPALAPQLWQATSVDGALIATGLMLARTSALRTQLSAYGNVCVSTHLGYAGFLIDRQV